MSNATEKLFIGGWLVMAGSVVAGVIAETYCNLKSDRRQQQINDLQVKALEYTNKAYEDLDSEKK